MNALFDRIDAVLKKVCDPKWKWIRSSICIVLSLLSMLAVFLLMFSPICTIDDGTFKIIAWDALKGMESEDMAVKSFAFVQLGCSALIILAILAILVFIFSALKNLKDENIIATKTKHSAVFAIVMTAIYTAFTYVFSPINSVMGGRSGVMLDYSPLVFAIVICVLYAILVGIPTSYRKNAEIEKMTELEKLDVDRKKFRRKLFLHQLEFFAFTAVMGAVSVVSLMSEILTVDFEKSAVRIPNMVISGSEIILGKADLSTKGEKTVAFMVFALFFFVLGALLLALVSFISRSSKFNSFAVTSVITSSAAALAVGLFGLYYNVVQELNEEIIQKLMGQYSILVEDYIKYEVKSNTMIYCFILIGVACVLIARRPFTKANEAAKQISRLDDAILSPMANIQINAANIAPAAKGAGVSGVGDEAELGEDIPDVDPLIASGQGADSDPCPAFTQLDRKLSVYMSEIERKRQSLIESPTLPALVDYIVQYARDSKHHLFYTPENIATFFAGLGATRLTILQGMSGTGKTSLPKIVAEALMSVCDIVEVESSWRDKNELLGYYNEFSKIYTPKKFTQALYRACLRPDTLTFIVLDEMNLSRIEYYFSDFLSLMENEPDKRQIQLLNVPLYRSYDGQISEYRALSDGHTMKIPQNVWFIGTANRDESTYDISDKVYDRAHTMNFDKRAQKPAFYNEPIPARYLPASELIRLFDEARANVRVDIDSYTVIKRAEALLEPYNISFGNRIAMQMEAFVSIYASCFAPTDQIIGDAIDIIMLSKVVKKLELKSVDDKETLAGEFEKLGLLRCSRFVLSLKED